jgi:hypothetical protein
MGSSSCASSKVVAAVFAVRINSSTLLELAAEMASTSQGAGKKVLQPSYSTPPLVAEVGSMMLLHLAILFAAMIMIAMGEKNLQSFVAEFSSTMTATPDRPEPMRQTYLSAGRRRDHPRFLKLWREIMVPSVSAAKMTVFGSLVRRASLLARGTP